MDKVRPEFDTIDRPWLIQRGSFRKVEEKDITGIDSLISFDYMGSSEFEWGALHHSLMRMSTQWDKFIVFQIDEIKDADGQYLQVLCRESQKDDIKKAILFMAEGKLDLKERAGLKEYLNCESEWSMRTDHWWDVTEDFGNFGSENDFTQVKNDWMCCFGDNIRLLVLSITTYKFLFSHFLNIQAATKSDAKFRDFDSKDYFERHPETVEQIAKIVKEKVPTTFNRPKPSYLTINEHTNIIEVTTVGGRHTVIKKQNVLACIEHPTSLEVVVKKSTTGAEIHLLIQDVEPSKERQLLVKKLKELIERNIWQQRRNDDKADHPKEAVQA